MIDNADNNNTMIEELLLLICRKFKLPYNTTHHRLCCQGYIINLAVKLFLFVIDKESIKEDKE